MQYFYGGRLQDGASVVALPAEVFYEAPLLKPYVVFDVARGVEARRGSSTSLTNQVLPDLAQLASVSPRIFDGRFQLRT